MSEEKIVGVIGGMGPEATVEFLRRLIAATPAADDSEHLHVLVDNNPKIPSRIAALIEGTGEDPTPVLQSMARSLQSQGAGFLVIPCNTAHHYLPAIADAVAIPVVDMVEQAIGRLRALPSRPARIAVLASPAVRMVGLYKARLEGSGFAALFPDADDEALLLDIIRAVKAGRIDSGHRQNYAEISDRLIEAGADAFLVACTELSLLDAPTQAPLPIVDALDALVETTIGLARGGA
jgi:aspartate racemase